MKNHNVLAEEIDALKKQLAVVNAEYKKVSESRRELRNKIDAKRAEITQIKIDAMDKNSDQYWSLMVKWSRSNVICAEQEKFFRENGTGNNWKVRSNGHGGLLLGYEHTSRHDAHECATFLNKLLSNIEHDEVGYIITMISIKNGRMRIKTDGTVTIYDFYTASEHSFQNTQAALESGVVKGLPIDGMAL